MEHYNVLREYPYCDLNLGIWSCAIERRYLSEFWHNPLQDEYVTFDCATQKVWRKGSDIGIKRKKPLAKTRRDLRSIRTPRKRVHRDYMGNKRRKYLFEIGHDKLHIRELQTTLANNFNVTPIILEDQPDLGAKTIIEKFEAYAHKCCYAIAVLTPDDIVQGDGAVELRPRPNIHFELGWFCRHLGRRRILMLVREGTDLTAFSDFQGVLHKTFRLHITEIFEDIKKELITVGF